MFHIRSTPEEVDKIVQKQDEDGNKVFETVKVTEMMIDIRELKNLVNEIRSKINIVMAGDYGWDEQDVKIAN